MGADRRTRPKRARSGGVLPIPDLGDILLTMAVLWVLCLLFASFGPRSDLGEYGRGVSLHDLPLSGEKARFFTSVLVVAVLWVGRSLRLRLDRLLEALAAHHEAGADDHSDSSPL